MFLRPDGVVSFIAIYHRVELADAGLRGQAPWDEPIPRKPMRTIVQELKSS